jgi:hypothetical protein
MITHPQDIPLQPTITHNVFPSMDPCQIFNEENNARASDPDEFGASPAGDLDFALVLETN